MFNALSTIFTESKELLYWRIITGVLAGLLVISWIFFIAACLVSVCKKKGKNAKVEQSMLPSGILACILSFYLIRINQPKLTVVYLPLTVRGLKGLTDYDHESVPTVAQSSLTTAGCNV